MAEKVQSARVIDRGAPARECDCALDQSAAIDGQDLTGRAKDELLVSGFRMKFNHAAESVIRRRISVDGDWLIQRVPG